MDGRSLQLLKFHDGTTTTSNGVECSLSQGAQAMKLEMSSIGTATVAFEGASDLGVWRPLLGAKELSEITLLTETSDLAPFYQFDITGLSKLRVRVTATSGSPLYVYGKIVG